MRVTASIHTNASTGFNSRVLEKQGGRGQFQLVTISGEAGQEVDIFLYTKQQALALAGAILAAAEKWEDEQ